MQLIRDSGIEYDAIDYYIHPIPKSTLKMLLKKMGIRAHDLLRKSDELFTSLRLDEINLTENEVIDLMVKLPDLIQRPIIEKGDRAILARPAERVKEIL